MSVCLARLSASWEQRHVSVLYYILRAFVQCLARSKHSNICWKTEKKELKTHCEDFVFFTLHWSPRMIFNNPHLLVFVPLCNSLPSSVGWPRDSFLTNRILQWYRMRHLKLGYRENVASVLCALSCPVCLLWRKPCCKLPSGRPRPCGEELREASHCQPGRNWVPQSSCLWGTGSWQPPCEWIGKWVSLQMRCQPIAWLQPVRNLEAEALNWTALGFLTHRSCEIIHACFLRH